MINKETVFLSLVHWQLRVGRLVVHPSMMRCHLSLYCLHTGHIPYHTFSIWQALERLNSKLEDENKQLIFQLQALLQQNQELLSQTLESSEHFREEENSYRDQLANMRRAKEKLEEKIMDQYKTYDRTGGKK